MNWIEDVFRLRDPLGVLSVYVGVDPHAESHRPPWQIQLDNDVRAIRQHVRAGRDHAYRVAVEERLTALESALERLVDPTAPGRGRALFAAVGSGETHMFSLQEELPTRAVLGELAHVLPLLRADDGRPRVLVLLGRDAVRVLESRAGRVDELRAFDVEPVVSDRAEQKRERHVEADHHRRLAAAASQIERLADARGWELGVVCGDPRGAELLADTLDRAGVPVEPVDRDLVDRSPAHALAELSPALAALAAERDLALAHAALDAAAAGGRGAAGLTPVLAALDASRVDHLVIDGERVGALDPGDPELAERVAQHAHDTGARITAVSGDAAAALAPVNGVAAILRG